jgi:hypothetical protein
METSSLINRQIRVSLLNIKLYLKLLGGPMICTRQTASHVQRFPMFNASFVQRRNKKTTFLQG